MGRVVSWKNMASDWPHLPALVPWIDPIAGRIEPITGSPRGRGEGSEFAAWRQGQGCGMMLA